MGPFDLIASRKLLQVGVYPRQVRLSIGQKSPTKIKRIRDRLLGLVKVRSKIS